MDTLDVMIIKNSKNNKQTIILNRLYKHRFLIDISDSLFFCKFFKMNGCDNDAEHIVY